MGWGHQPKGRFRHRNKKKKKMSAPWQEKKPRPSRTLPPELPRAVKIPKRGTPTIGNEMTFLK